MKDASTISQPERRQKQRQQQSRRICSADHGALSNYKDDMVASVPPFSRQQYLSMEPAPVSPSKTISAFDNGYDPLAISPPTGAVQKTCNPSNTIEIPNRTYQPYATSSLETPLWHLIMEPLCLGCLQPIFRLLYHSRGALAHPIRSPVVPRMVAGVLPSFMAHTTVGDLLLLLPLAMCLLLGSHHTFVAPALNRSGTMAAYCAYLTFFTANKSNSVFSLLFGISYERLIGLHWLCALGTVILGSFHAYVAYVYGGDDQGDSSYSKAAARGHANLVRFFWDGDSNWTGTVLLGCLVGSTCLSFFPIVRRLAYNIWYSSHILLGAATLVFLFLHHVRSAVLVTVWWILDVMVRYGIQALGRNRTVAQIRLIGTDAGSDRQKHEPAVELRIPLPPGFSYNAGQFVRLAVPAIHPLEFHPISISSSPYEKELTLHVRRLGDWTDRLVQLAEENTEIPVCMEGPYGAMSIDLQDDNRYKLVMVVGGGIGITPCQSIGKALLFEHRVYGRHLKKLQYVWVVRDMQMVRDIPPLLLDHMDVTNGASCDPEWPGEDYSTNSPGFQRMVDRKEKLRSGELENSSKGGALKKANSFERGSEAPIANEASSRRRLRRPALVQADIHCTRPPKDGFLHAIDDEELHRQLPFNLHHGRPDWNELFQKMRADAIFMGETNVAVIGCGPPTLIKSLEEACRYHSSPVVGCSSTQVPVFFDMHKEHFDL